MKPNPPHTARARGLWAQPEVPHDGWTCLGIEDTGAPRHLCEMCQSQPCRYVHAMWHADYADVLRTGSVCAGTWRALTLAGFALVPPDRTTPTLPSDGATTRSQAARDGRVSLPGQERHPTAAKPKPTIAALVAAINKPTRLPRPEAEAHPMRRA
jgi:hypothetical protein